jgi:DnaD/phage-associated family protein
MDCTFGFSATNGIFALPCEAVDRYINEATVNEIKVLLYIYRHSGSKLSLEQLCEALGMNPEEALRTINYWSEKKLFTYSISNQVTNETAATQHKEAAAAAAPPKRVIDIPAQLTADEITKLALYNPEIKFLLNAVPERLGRTITQSECSSIIYLYEGVGLPADVILMVIEYCVSIGKSKIQYVVKTAVGWAEDGVDTHELAESKIKALEARRSFEGQIKGIMGITGRVLTPTEREYLNRWLNEYNTPAGLVKLAYEKCIDRTGKLTFSYINSILKSWHEKGFSTEDQAKNENKPISKQKNPSFNVDEYINFSMKKLLND